MLLAVAALGVGLFEQILLSVRRQWGRGAGQFS
jgi:hypothetical protein